MAMEKVGREICRRLRSKGMFIDAEPDPNIPGTSDGFYWCTHTMNCLGPDGKVADKQQCKSGRGCFESR
jgi:hypothetical protein